MLFIPEQDLKKMTELNNTTNINPNLVSKPCYESAYLGTVDYAEGLRIQKTLLNLASQKNQISVIGLQHPDVITLGRRCDEHNDIMLNALELPVVRSTRGGLATIHSPGQLIIYPILHLRSLSLGIRDYVQILLRSTQQLLNEFGIYTELDIKGAGLFTTNGKIAFCGIEVTGGVTQHGISINVKNDMEVFRMIRSCGINNLKMDQMQNYAVDETLESLFKKWNLLFKKNINI